VKKGQKRIASKPTSTQPSLDQWVMQGGIDPEIQTPAIELKEQETVELEGKEKTSKPFPHRVSFDMETLQYERLDFASFRSKQSKNKILREALENWLKAHGY
jgi:hypothetical protein